MREDRIPTLSALALAGLLCLTGACASSRVNMLTDQKLPPTPKDVEIEAYFGEATRPHERIAQVRSAAMDGRDDDTKARQLEELKRSARKLGADAVQNVRILKSRGDGWVWDPATPFPAVKNGPFEQFLLQADAIKFVNPDEVSPSVADKSPVIVDTDK